MGYTVIKSVFIIKSIVSYLSFGVTASNCLPNEDMARDLLCASLCVYAAGHVFKKLSEVYYGNER